MNIEFTKEQYERLLKMAYIGNMIINSQEFASDENNGYDQLLEFLFCSAKDAGLEECVQMEDGCAVPSQDFEFNEEIAEYLNDYDDSTFWNEFCDRLAQRDLVDSLGETALAEMNDIKRILMISGLSDKYDNYFMEHALDTIELKDVNVKQNIEEVQKIVDNLMEDEALSCEDI